jgi:MoaA/NifB/PqqE/SkfB family radical SAM enzyme
MRYLTPAINYADMFLRNHLQIEPTTRCNLSCPTCPHKDGVPIADITGETLSTILGKHRFIASINLQGLGEPTMHPNIAGIAKHARRHCNDIWMVTNGTRFVPALVNHLARVTVSLDTMDAYKAAKLKGKGYDIGTVIANILKYSELIPTTVNFTRTISNYVDEPYVRDWCEENGVVFNLTRVQNWSAPDEPGWQANHSDVMQERGAFGVMPKEKFLCQWRIMRCYYYRADGVRNPCCRRLGYREYGEGCCDTCPD